MKTKVPLKAKTPLKSKAVLKAKSKPKKQKVPTITALRRKADKLFGHYIRLRDAEFVGGFQWIAECISDGRSYVVRWYDEDDGKWHWGRQEELGHFVGRGNYYLRYNEMNCNDQCVRCNKYLSGNNAAYAIALDKKYGDGTAAELIRLADEHKRDSLTRSQLEEVIETATEYLNWCYEREKQWLNLTQ